MQSIGTLAAFAMGAATRHKPSMVFDWARAARLIAERKPLSASAGLSGDWDHTADEIYYDGAPVTGGNTYLASKWATPMLEMDGDLCDCFVMESDTTWDEATVWPPEALEIIGGSMR